MVSATKKYSKTTAHAEKKPNMKNTPYGLRALYISDSVTTDSTRITSHRIYVLTPRAMSEQVSVTYTWPIGSQVF